MNVHKFVLMNVPDNFTVGKIRYFIHNWCKLTHDKLILDVVKGYKIKFIWIIITVTRSEMQDHVSLSGADHQIKLKAPRLV